METQAELGKISVAPEVLAATARLTALAVPGVARLVAPPGMARLLQAGGVRVELVDRNQVRVEIFVMTNPDTNMLSVGRKIRAEVTRALQEMVGVDVRAVDVHIEDVAFA